MIKWKSAIFINHYLINIKKNFSNTNYFHKILGV